MALQICIQIKHAYIAHQGTRAKVCHISPGQCEEISDYMVQQKPKKRENLIMKNRQTTSMLIYKLYFTKASLKEPLSN